MKYKPLHRRGETKTTEEYHIVVRGEAFILERHQVILDSLNYFSSNFLDESMRSVFVQNRAIQCYPCQTLSGPLAPLTEMRSLPWHTQFGSLISLLQPPHMPSRSVNMVVKVIGITSQMIEMLYNPSPLYQKGVDAASFGVIQIQNPFCC